VLATCILPLLTETPAPLFELRPAKDKGLGLFATSSILRGTRIIEEAPLVVIPTDFDLAIRLGHLVAEMKRITPDEKKAFFSLYHSLRAGAIPEALRTPAQNDADPSADQNAKAEEMLTAFAIFETNSFQMGEDGEYGTGVFASYSRLNHSCTPNTHASYNPDLEKLTVHATRGINKNEEILTTYIDVYQSCEQRNADLATREFRCRCKCCEGPRATASDIRRKHIFETGNELAACAEVLSSHPGLTIKNNFHVPLGLAESLLKVYREEDISGFRLSGV
jgi:hypothetical protein